MRDRQTPPYVSNSLDIFAILVIGILIEKHLLFIITFLLSFQETFLLIIHVQVILNVRDLFIKGG